MAVVLGENDAVTPLAAPTAPAGLAPACCHQRRRRQQGCLRQRPTVNAKQLSLT